MGQRGQHHTSLWGNTGNTILMYGATRATPRRQHHTSLWGNAGNTILMYGATRATPYFFMGQRGQHHTYVWGNVGNTIIFMHGAMRTTCTIIISLCSNTGNTMHTYYDIVWGNTILYGLCGRHHSVYTHMHTAKNESTSPPTTLLQTLTNVFCSLK